MAYYEHRKKSKGSPWSLVDNAQLLVGVDLTADDPKIGSSVNGLATVNTLCSQVVSSGIIEVIFFI